MMNGQTVASSRVAIDRRRFPRIQLLGDIHGHAEPFATPFALLDIGSGGFAVESTMPFEPAVEYTFRFGALHQFGPIRAKNVHCLHVSRGGATLYVAGFSFLVETAEERQAVENLIAEANDVRVLMRA
jgi:hypothetical protein